MTVPISRIIVFTRGKDLRLTRACIASIRYWYPAIPISLVKDEGKGEFDTLDIQEAWDVSVEKCGKDRLGGNGFLIKLEPLFLQTTEKILLLDNDTIITGPILDWLNAIDADFIVAEDKMHGELDTDYGREIVKSFLFDYDKLQKLVPDFPYPKRMFCAGCLVITTGRYQKSDVSKWIEWRDRGGRPINPLIFLSRAIRVSGISGWNANMHVAV